MIAIDGAEQSLEEEAMIDLIHDAVQVLLDHPKGEGMIVSCYADTSSPKASCRSGLNT